VHWSLGKVAEDGAHFDIIVGQWGDDSNSANRRTVALEYRPGLGVMVIDATARKISRESMAGKALNRDEIIGTPLAQQAFEIFNAIWLQDKRIAEVKS
jgi:hypothetical protein